ncbi:MAG: glycosyltransferase family 39 protein [Desulfobacterales bacterium]|nr:glycosyltransferase family 39 protein [Desulfobacterales bacterium]
MKVNNRSKTIPSEIISYYLILGGLFLLFLLCSFFYFFDHDEIETLHTAWKIWNGGVIYIDFFQHHNPFLYYTLIPLLDSFGESILTIRIARVIIAILDLFIYLVTYMIAVELFEHKKTGLIAIILLSSLTIFFNKAIEIRPDVPQVLFGLMCIYFLILHFKKGSAKYALASAMSLGMSFLFLQKAVFLIIPIFIVQVFRIYKGKIEIQQIVLYWFSFTIILLPYAIYLFYKGWIKDYVFLNWTINIKQTETFSLFNELTHSFLLNPFTWVFFVIGLFFLRKYLVREIGVLSLALLASVFVVRVPYQQYYMMFLPLMTIIAANGFVNIITSKKTALYILIVAISLPMFTYVRKLVIRRNTEQIEKIQYVLSNTTKVDHVYDGKNIFNVFRKDLDFFWYSVDPNGGGLTTYQVLSHYEYNIYELIDKFKPKIISNYHIEDLNHEVIINHYHNVPGFDDLLIRTD